MSIASARGTMKILAISGSLQAKSSNKSLLARAEQLISPPLEWRRSEIVGRLPHYNADLDRADPPSVVSEWRAELDAADAVLFASPEYGMGMPGSLKNAIDWVVGSGSFYKKPVAVTCAGAGPHRGEMGLSMFVQTLNAIDALIVWNAPIVVPKQSIRADGIIDDPNVDAALKELLAEVRRGVETARATRDG
jgi:NAD(P)H-dependent FMN reductase